MRIGFGLFSNIRWLAVYDAVFDNLHCEETFCIKKKTFIAVDISSNLCGISGVKVWDHLVKGMKGLARACCLV